jgi:peptidoglycan recognition protein
MTLVFVSRDQWGARPPTKTQVKQGMVDNFFLHHAVSADLGDEKKEVRGIQKLHQDDGSSDIDYGFLMGRTGTIYEGRGWGIQDGATATGFQRDPDGNFYGREVTLCLLGNFEVAQLSDELVDRIREFIAFAVEQGRLKEDPVIRGHRDVRATACPGQHAYDRLDDIRVPWEGEEDVPLTPEECSALAYIFGMKERIRHETDNSVHRPTEYVGSDGLGHVGAAQAGWDDKDAELGRRSRRGGRTEDPEVTDTPVPAGPGG